MATMDHSIICGQDEGEGGGQKMYVFVHAQGKRNVHAGRQKMATFRPRSC